MTDEELLAKIDELIGPPEGETELEREKRLAAIARLRDAHRIRTGTVIPKK